MDRNKIIERNVFIRSPLEELKEQGGANRDQAEN